MKILLVNKFFFLNGGSETVFFQERNFLINRGHKIFDFSMEHPKNFSSEYSDYFVSNVDYRKGLRGNKLALFFKRCRTGFDFIHNHEAVKRLKSLIKKEKPDIAHLHNIYHQLTPSIIPLLKNAGIRVVLTLHDYKLICPSYLMINNDTVCNKCQGKHFWHATLQRCQEGSYFKSLPLSIEAYWHKWARSYESVDLFLSPSKFIAELAARYRIDKRKIKVLHNGIDTKKYNPSCLDNNYAIYFGRISREKGIEVLLKAYKLIFAEQNKNAKVNIGLKILGTGPLFEKLKNEYFQVEFLEYKTGNELKKLISESSFVVVPSQCNENCSMSVLESMAYGKPVISSRIGGLPEQVEDNKTGFLFQMGNIEELKKKMTLLSKNKELRTEMGKEARKNLEKKYSFEAHCAKLMKIYEDLLSRN